MCGDKYLFVSPLIDRFFFPLTLGAGSLLPAVLGSAAHVLWQGRVVIIRLQNMQRHRVNQRHHMEACALPVVGPVLPMYSGSGVLVLYCILY